MADPEHEDDPCEGCEFEDNVCRENCSNCEHFEDPCEGCQFEDDICAENCDGCENFEEDDPCEGCEFEDDVCEENCAGCENYEEEEDPCEGCSFQGQDCKKMGISCSRRPDQMSEDNTDSYNEDTTSVLERVADQLFDAVGREFRIEVYESPEVNAFTNGAIVFVSSTAVQVLDEDELACLISHEIGHIEEEHVEQAVHDLQNVVRDAAHAFRKSNGIVSGLVKGLLVGAAGYARACSNQRNRELEADLKEQELVEKAGFDPNAPIRMLEKHGGSGGRLFDRHPTGSQRIKNLKRNGR